VTIEVTLRVRASRRQVKAMIARLPSLIAGGGTLADALKMRLGLTALGLIYNAFMAKSEGGTDDAGGRWVPLKKTTIAYSRTHRKIYGKGGKYLMSMAWLPKGSRRAQDAPSWMLTSDQRKRWWALYRSFGGTALPGKAYHRPGSRSIAAAMAWRILKAEGAKTLLETYGNLRVPILRDTGLLLNSLTPGIVVGEESPPLPLPKVPDQVLRSGLSDVVVGTNRKFAVVHHEGRGHVPQRRLWPAPGRWPNAWWHQIQKQMVYGVIDVVKYLFQ
jgi:hypothetical protein